MNAARIPAKQIDVAPRPAIARYRWLLLRRLCQLSILTLFLLGPWFGWWIVKGNLASSIVLDTVSLSDPFIALQSLAAGHRLETSALIGAATVAVFYWLVGGRAYCAWVCPINIVTDLAYWCRTRLGYKKDWKLPRATRYWVLLLVLSVSAVAGTIAWEFVNPITILQRGLVYGIGAAWTVVLLVFCFDLLVSKRGWCGSLCPVGAFYGALGRRSIVRVSAIKRELCTDCGDCYRVCPEPHIITPALYGASKGLGPLVDSGDCTACGACIDACDENVFAFVTRFKKAA